MSWYIKGTWISKWLISLFLATEDPGTDGCTNSDECLNGGQCREGTCRCAEGFEGSNCGDEIGKPKYCTRILCLGITDGHAYLNDYFSFFANRGFE